MEERSEIEVVNRKEVSSSDEFIMDHKEHPSIQSAIKNMIAQGRKTEDIVRVVGMPREVVESYQREAKRKEK